MQDFESGSLGGHRYYSLFTIYLPERFFHFVSAVLRIIFWCSCLLFPFFHIAHCSDWILLEVPNGHLFTEGLTRLLRISCCVNSVFPSLCLRSRKKEVYPNCFPCYPYQTTINYHHFCCQNYKVWIKTYPPVIKHGWKICHGKSGHVPAGATFDERRV